MSESAFSMIAAWLASPLSGASTHDIAPWAYWHARCMVMAWGVLLPLGVVVARYFKVLPGQDWPKRLDHKFWWHTHQISQWLGVAVMGIGVYLVIGQSARTDPSAIFHQWLGWLVIAIAVTQVISIFLRGTKGGPTGSPMRGDHYDMTVRRVVFERMHKSLGWFAVLAAIVVIGSGLLIVDAPRWMAVTIIVWWVILVIVVGYLQRSGRAIDTYQAIWGPSSTHPGNQRQPIGIGVKRYDANTYRQRFLATRQTRKSEQQ